MHTRLRRFNTRDTYPEQTLDNDLCQVVVARGTTVFVRGQVGQDLDTVSRSLGVTAATLSGWRDAFLDGGEASLATKPTDGEERESDRLKARLGEMLLERELLEQKIALLESNSGPLARRSRGDEPHAVA